ncbi:MCE family protein [Mycolicibacterium sp. CBM1]
MSDRSTIFKLAVSALVLLLFTAVIVVVFGQIRFDRTDSYSAIFVNTSGLRAGQFVRASGVEVGKVSDVELIDDDQRVRVDFEVNHDLPLYQGTMAAIRYADVVGNRYLELKRGDSDKRLPPGGTIELASTSPALDLDALIGSFRPLFRSMDPDKVNNVAQSLITVFQGQGGTIDDILNQTAELTSALADRDQTIGEVIKNLNTVLDITVKHQQGFGDSISNVQALISGLKNQQDPIADSVAGISNSANTLADFLMGNRALMHSTLGYLNAMQQPLVDQRDKLDGTLQQIPKNLRTMLPAAGVYGDFVNFYLCDITVMLNGLQPGGPVREVKLTSQPTGRCTPQ